MTLYMNSTGPYNTMTCTSSMGPYYTMTYMSSMGPYIGVVWDLIILGLI